MKSHRKPSSVGYPLMTAAIAAIPSYLVGSMFGAVIGSPDHAYYGGLLAAAVFCGVWTGMRWHMLPQDDAPAEPKRPEWTRLEVVTESGTVGDRLQLPLDDNQVSRLARALAIDGLAYNEAASRMRLSRSLTERVRTELMARGYLCWNNDAAHQQGVRMTAKGLATMRGLAG